MILMAFSLLDTKTGHFSPPFFMGGRGQAIRAVIDLGGDLSTSVGRHPADYALYLLGLFNDQNGLLEPQHPEALGTVQSFLPAPAPIVPLFHPAEATSAMSNGHAG